MSKVEQRLRKMSHEQLTSMYNCLNVHRDRMGENSGSDRLEFWNKLAERILNSAIVLASKHRALRPPIKLVINLGGEL